MYTYINVRIYKQGTGFSGKIVFFHNSLQPLPLLHRCKRPSKLSTQCEFTDLLLAGKFLYNQKQPSAGEGEVANFENSWKKTQFFMNFEF